MLLLNVLVVGYGWSVFLLVSLRNVGLVYWSFFWVIIGFIRSGVKFWVFIRGERLFIECYGRRMRLIWYKLFIFLFF